MIEEYWEHFFILGAAFTLFACRLMAAMFSSAENVMVMLNGVESEDSMNEMKVMWFQRVWNKI